MGLATSCMSSTTSRKMRWSTKKNGFPLLQSHGILQREMFAVKNMDVNSNLMRLKLDLVYRDVSTEEGQKRFAELTETLPVEAPKAEPVKPKKKVIKRIVVKAK